MGAAAPTRLTHAERMRSGDGYFGPESVIRRLGNTPVTPRLGGGAAVLLQVAHRLVACGVVEHSGYERDLWKRLAEALCALYQVTYGNKAEAERAGAHVRQAHRRVRGTTTCQLGVFPRGTRYSAPSMSSSGITPRCGRSRSCSGLRRVFFWVHTQSSARVTARVPPSRSPHESGRRLERLPHRTESCARR